MLHLFSQFTNLISEWKLDSPINMADWYWSKEDFVENTPSRKDGISVETEKRYRKDGVTLIILCSTSLGLHHDTQATGAVFFHRFFMLQSFKQFDRWVVAASCLFLAGKVEETPKKCKDILKTVKAHLTELQWARFGPDPKDELMIHEKILLQTVMFDLVVENPYTHMLDFSKNLMELATKAKKKEEKVEDKQEKLQNLVQLAWTFINDSLCTTLPLHWEPQAIAVAFLYRAAKMSNVDIHTFCGTRRSWWRQYADTVDEHDLEEISAELTDLYSQQDDSSTKSEAGKESGGNTPLGSSHSSPLPTASHHHVGGAGGTGGGGGKTGHEQRPPYHKLSSSDSSSSLSQTTVALLLASQMQQQQQQQIVTTSSLGSTSVTSGSVPNQPQNAFDIAASVARQKAQQQATLASMYQFGTSGGVGLPPNMLPPHPPTNPTQLAAYMSVLEKHMGISTTAQTSLGHTGSTSYMNFGVPPMPTGAMGVPTPPLPPSDVSQPVGMLHHQLSQGSLFQQNSGASGNNSSSFGQKFSSSYRHGHK